ncbi:uncharacterized protein LOC142167029 [Nicotiana tabacum]|uniref:Uncharacterized protein LOC142167029 n=1 Tax=Nicotiana tabacum TaxID=4097 RepID=A0AC58SE84_TOBAC
MVWNLLANSWYSVLINGQASGFFHSTRGFKQGDPLSPALFILSAEVLSRSLNKLFEDKRFKGFGMPKWTDPFNHLAYVDGTIIFAYADSYSLEKIIEVPSKFFWSNKEEGKSRHWTKWQNLCLHKEEEGVGFRSLIVVSKALFDMLWLNLRTSKSLWSKFMWHKYCKKEMPTIVQFRKGSHVWRIMLEAREEVEHEILWEMNRRETNVWHQNWTGLGALYHVVPLDFPINEELQKVVDLRDDDGWNEQLLEQSFPRDIADHIRLDATPVVITWEIWKRRKSMKYGGSVSCNRVIHEMNKTLQYLARVRVTWQLPYEGWFKCNTDGASRGNLGTSSYGFCMRDCAGNVVYAKAEVIGETTNIVAEAEAILEWLVYCVERWLHPLIMETDSMVMRKIIDGE